MCRFHRRLIMGLVDKFKDILGMQPEEDDIDEMDSDLSYSENEEDDSDNEFYSDSTAKRNKVVKVHDTTQLQVVIVKPEKFEDASTIADHLNDKHTVVLNLESCSKDISRRLIDFLSGVAYANRGQIKKVANCTFIITPYHGDIMGDLMDELENSGIFF